MNYYIPTPKSCCYQCQKANRPACRLDCPEWAEHEAKKKERYERGKLRIEAVIDHRRTQI